MIKGNFFIKKHLIFVRDVDIIILSRGKARVVP
jgi:hypothetical protein